MRAFVAIPTLSRADLLIRNKGFLENIKTPDFALILDNGGNQKIDIDVPIVRSEKNLGVAESWNMFLHRAFVADNFDLCVILQDDIIWDAARLESAKWLVENRPDVDLFLSFLQFSVQVHRPTTIDKVGFFDTRFPGYAGDDDYAIRIAHSLNAFYERRAELHPLPGSIIEGTPKPVPGGLAHRELLRKWGVKTFEINIPNAPWYMTNRGVTFPT